VSMSISTLWGDGMRKDGLSQALSAFGRRQRLRIQARSLGIRAPAVALLGWGVRDTQGGPSEQDGSHPRHGQGHNRKLKRCCRQASF